MTVAGKNNEKIDSGRCFVANDKDPSWFVLEPSNRISVCLKNSDLKNLPQLYGKIGVKVERRACTAIAFRKSHSRRHVKLFIKDGKFGSCQRRSCEMDCRHSEQLSPEK